MITCFCDNCGKQTVNNGLLTTKINGFAVDLCYECHSNYASELEAAQNKVDKEFMSNMKHPPFAFKYSCM